MKGLIAQFVSFAQRHLHNTWVHRFPFANSTYRWMTRSLLGGKKTVEFRGLEFEVPENDITVVPGLLSGRYEAFELDLFLDVVDNANVVVDVGANIGVHSVLAASRRRLGPKIWAFEPVPDNLAIFNANLARNNTEGVQVVPVAVGDCSGRVSIGIDSLNSGTHSITAVENPQLMVDQVSLDEFMPVDISVDVLKIDVEGFEGRVISGASRILGSKPTIFMEFTPRLLRLAGTEPKQLIDDLLLVYPTAFIISERSRELLEFRSSEELNPADDTTYLNLVFVGRDEAEAKLRMSVTKERNN